MKARKTFVAIVLLFVSTLASTAYASLRSVTIESDSVPRNANIGDNISIYLGVWGVGRFGNSKTSEAIELQYYLSRSGCGDRRVHLKTEHRSLFLDKQTGDTYYRADINTTLTIPNGVYPGPWYILMVANAGSAKDCRAAGMTLSTPPKRGVLQLSSASYEAMESDGFVTATVNRTDGSDGFVSATVATSNGTATAPDDYTEVSTTVTWADGEAGEKTVDIPVINNGIEEPQEQFYVSIGNATGGARLGGEDTATVTIIDDDGNCGGEQYSGFLSGTGDTQVQPNGTWFYHHANGTYSGELTGPDGTDFDLYLYKWEGGTSNRVSSSASNTSNEVINHPDSSGYFLWLVNSYNGSGSYNLCVALP